MWDGDVGMGAEHQLWDPRSARVCPPFAPGPCWFAVGVQCARVYQALIAWCMYVCCSLSLIYYIYAPVLLEKPVDVSVSGRCQVYLAVGVDKWEGSCEEGFLWLI